MNEASKYTITHEQWDYIKNGVRKLMEENAELNAEVEFLKRQLDNYDYIIRNYKEDDN